MSQHVSTTAPTAALRGSLADLQASRDRSRYNTDAKSSSRSECNGTASGGGEGLLRTEGIKYNTKYLERSLNINAAKSPANGATASLADMVCSPRAHSLSGESEELLALVHARRARLRLGSLNSRGDGEDDPNAEWNRRVSVPTPRGLQREKIVSPRIIDHGWDEPLALHDLRPNDREWDQQPLSRRTPRGLQRDKIGAHMR